jgi:hypothetical protein
MMYYLVLVILLLGFLGLAQPPVKVFEFRNVAVFVSDELSSSLRGATAEAPHLERGGAFSVGVGGLRFDSVDFSYLVNGVKRLWYDGVPGPILILDNQTVPIVSGDEDTSPVLSVVAVAREYGRGRVVATLGGFFTNKALALFDNKVFAKNVVEWLGRFRGRRILFSLGHREWYGGSNYDDFRSMLEALGYNVTRYYGVLTPEILSQVDILMIGTAWGNFTKDETEAVLNFVRGGGGLLMSGLGWSWPGLTLDNYPMNLLGEYFGIRWVDSYVEDPTDNYENTPVFHVFYPNIEIGSLPQAYAYIVDTLKKHGDNLPQVLENDPSLRRRFFTANEVLVTAALNLRINDQRRLELYNFYRRIFMSYSFFKRSVVLSQDSMAWIRERAYYAFISSAILYGDAAPQDAAEALGLDGRYLDIWRNFQVLVLDGGKSSEKQLDFIYRLLSLVPRELHNLRFISVRDFLGSAPDARVQSLAGVSGFSRLTQRLGAVNIFGGEVGAVRENEFPEDVEPYETDVFSIVAVHEVNHVVDAYYVSRNAVLSEWKTALIKRAGNNHMNYLRSMFPDGFFLQAPQEFFASLSNQWFANTSHTLKLALARFDKGYAEPLNQFLFFAEVYSRGGNTTLFYSIDTWGNIQRREIPVLRDQKGHIIALVDREKKYMFTLGPDGAVTSYSIQNVASTPPVATETSTKTVKETVTTTATVTTTYTTTIRETVTTVSTLARVETATSVVTTTASTTVTVTETRENNLSWILTAILATALAATALQLRRKTKTITLEPIDDTKTRYLYKPTKIHVS